MTKRKELGAGRVTPVYEAVRRDILSGRFEPGAPPPFAELVEQYHSSIAGREFVSRLGLRRMVTEDEVADVVVAMLHMSGPSRADVDLSARRVAR